MKFKLFIIKLFLGNNSLLHAQTPDNALNQNMQQINAGLQFSKLTNKTGNKVSSAMANGFTFGYNYGFNIKNGMC